ncbi:protein I'm not dead yet-like [Belonocnema kinseyi]|uniref:protein I'm not dead yet-like n=1 Tax=Belonocnema kinseyi TaxID=2817044 RepID=UPI00143D7582|nr:protein I'm not dead yet-like [Belonocnema kinseyi]
MEGSNLPEGVGQVSMCVSTLTFLKMYWKAIVTFSWPLLILPIIVCSNTLEARCGYVILIMAAYWITDCLPMGITSLIPVVLFPMFSIMSTDDIGQCYMNDTIMVFIGGLSIALAVEHCNLHMRIAVGVMKIVGCSHRKLLAGLIFVTTAVSMWISNTAATAMMIPIIIAILEELEREGLGKMYTIEVDPEDPNREPLLIPSKITKAYFMATAYSATFGGTGTLVGTGTNLTFKGIFESTFPKSEGINFTQWMIWAFPQMFINASITWIYFQIFYLGLFRPKSQDAQLAYISSDGEKIANRVLQEKWKNLGRMTFHETAVALLFVACIFLWIFRKPGFVVGWSQLITDVKLKDSNPVIMITILMFIIPRDPSFLYSCSKDRSKRPKRSSEALITWKYIANKMPWNLMFLLGGGFAISKGSNASGLSRMLGEALKPLENYNLLFILSILCIFITCITEFTSNVGVANIVLPVVAQMCVAMKIHPFYLMIPATVCCSFSFRLPVGTPPNAIVTATGRIPIQSLIVGGCIPSIYSLIVLLITFSTWGVYLYDTEIFPDWAADSKDATEG